MKEKILSFLRALTMAGAMLSMGALVIGILYNDGAWSIPATVGAVVFSGLRFGLFATEAEKAASESEN